MKSRLQKLDGLTYKELKNKIEKVIKEKYENIILKKLIIEQINIVRNLLTEKKYKKIIYNLHI